MNSNEKIKAARARLRQARPENVEGLTKYWTVDGMPNIQIREGCYLKGSTVDNATREYGDPLFMVYTNMRNGDPALFSYRGGRRSLPEALEPTQALQAVMTVTA